MARDMSDKDILKMELEQLQKEVKNTREPVSSSACWLAAQINICQVLYILPPLQFLFIKYLAFSEDGKRQKFGILSLFPQVSKTAKEICEWVEAQAAGDPLIKGVPEDKNPFKEKGGCIIT